MIHGKVLFLTRNNIYFSKGLTIFKHNKESKVTTIFLKLNLNYFIYLLSKIHILSRFFRYQIHHMIEDGSGGFYIIFNRNITRVSNEEGQIWNTCKIIGSRPLCVMQYGGKLFYGEYSNNKERKSVGIYSFDGFKTVKVMTINNIRHIHGLFYDEYSESIYMTTGDYGQEAAIWKLNFENIAAEKFFYGTQQDRAVQLLFDQEYIYYATDTPSEHNYIYKINKNNKVRTKIGEVDSSVFYGTKINNNFYFSTVAEPSNVNSTDTISLIEVKEKKLNVIATFRKDFYSMKYFQYGQLIFPNIESGYCCSELWVYKLSVVSSGFSIKIF